MQKIVPYIIVSVFYFAANHSIAQSVSFKLADFANERPIVAAFVVNQSRNANTTSNHEGLVSIKFQAGDTLVVSHINFKSKGITAENLASTIYMTENEVILNEVIVSNMPASAKAFKDRLVGMDNVQDDTFIPYGLSKGKSPGPIPVAFDPSITNNWRYAIAKPFSFIQKKLSKDHKMKAKYYQLRANRAQQISYDKKINRELVSQLTELEGSALTDFIEYLNLNKAEVLKMSDYQLAIHIKKQHTQYERDKTKQEAEEPKY